MATIVRATNTMHELNERKTNKQTNKQTQRNSYHMHSAVKYFKKTSRINVNVSLCVDLKCLFSYNYQSNDINLVVTELGPRE